MGCHYIWAKWQPLLTLSLCIGICLNIIVGQQQLDGLIPKNNTFRSFSLKGSNNASTPVNAYNGVRAPASIQNCYQVPWGGGYWFIHFKAKAHVYKIRVFYHDSSSNAGRFLRTKWDYYHLLSALTSGQLFVLIVRAVTETVWEV